MNSNTKSSTRKINMNLSKYLVGLVAAVVLTACGGGGGNAGTSGTSGTGGTGGTGETPAVSATTKISVKLTDLNGVPVQSIPVSLGGSVVVVLTTETGTPIANKVVKISGSLFSSAISFPNGNSATTDSQGVAKIKVQRTTSVEFGFGQFAINFDGADTSSSVNSINLRADPPVLRMELLDSLGQVTNSVGATGVTSIRTTLKFEDGTPVTGKRVEITGDLTRLAFPEGGAQLTDTAGVAIIKVTRASLSAAGAGTLSAAATISGQSSQGTSISTVVTGLLDFTLGIADISLTDLDVGATSLAAFGNRPISVKAKINGVLASSTSIPITFNASCGTTLPATVTTDASGTATTTYTASLANCAGTTVFISASAAGATPVSKTIVVANSIATNVQFVSVVPSLIYLKDSVGTTQSQATFKVVDSSGNPLQNQKIRLSLSNIATGVSLDKIGNTGPVYLTTDSLGLASASVFSGTVPTSLNIKATLLDSANAATSIFSNSNLLTVASGRPTQRSLSLAFGKLSIEAADVDGVETTVTLSMADRQGNPVPPGTQVNFVTESGVMLPAVCFVPPPTPATVSSPAIPTSYCTVTLRSSGTRTANGLVSVLAYVEGEEDFIDINGNNIYDGSDTFTDLGRAFRDDNGSSISGANNSYDAGEFQVPRLGTVVCSTGACPADGVWGNADVRKQGTIVFATAAAKITGNPDVAGFDVIVSDENKNSVPTGSVVSVSVTDNSSLGPITSPPGTAAIYGSCTLMSADSFVVPSRLGNFPFHISLKNCAPRDLVSVKVKTPGGVETRVDFIIPGP